MNELSGWTILVVDDDQDVLETVVDGLQYAGANCRSALRAKAALELLLSQNFDLVLSDIRMPQEDGFWLLEQVRASRPIVPFIFMTGDSEQKVEISKEKASALICKPFLPNALVTLLLAHLKSK